MPFVPAVCDQCFTVFSSDLFVKHTQMNLTGYKAGPCPHCSQQGHVISGVYQFIAYMLSSLKEQEKSIIELNEFYDLLSVSQEYNVDHSQIKNEMIHHLEGFEDLLLILPGTEEDFILCLNLILQTLSAVIDISIKANKNNNHTIKIDQHIKVNEVIDRIYTNNTGVEKRLF